MEFAITIQKGNCFETRKIKSPENRVRGFYSRYIEDNKSDFIEFNNFIVNKKDIILVEPIETSKEAPPPLPKMHDPRKIREC